MSASEHDEIRPEDQEMRGEDNSDSESDSDDDVGVTASAKDINEIRRLEEELASNPNSYDTHEQYIAVVRRCNMRERCRSAREAMSQKFPLSETLWREWIADESEHASSAEDLQRINELFEKGVEDFLSVPLWLDYLGFAEAKERAEQSERDSSGMLALFERAITAGGLDYEQGGELWSAWREYELKDEGAEGAAQAGRVRSLFHRQLRIPLADHAETLEAYLEWEEVAAQAAVAQREAARTGVLIAERAPHEAAVALDKAADAALLAAFLNYVDFEAAKQQPVRAQCLFERALARMPVTSELWLRYLAFLEWDLGDPPAARRAYARAVRACPWVGALWCRYLRFEERLGAGSEVLDQIYQRAQGGGMGTYAEWLDLFLARADALRRAAAAAAPPTGPAPAPAPSQPSQQAIVAQLREVFQTASDYLAAYFPEQADPSLRLHGYWAECELRFGGEEAARAVWEACVASPLHGAHVEAWRAYIAMERRLGNLTHARKLYSRCFARRFQSDRDSYEVCTEWLRMEREVGTVEDYCQAELKLQPRLLQLHHFASQGTKKAPTNEEMQKMRQAADPNFGKGKSSKRKQRGEEEGPEGSGPAEGASKKAKLQAAAAPAPDPDAKPSNKPKGGADPEWTAFVSNLLYTCEEADLRAFFEPCGAVVSVKMLYNHATQKFKGLAYVTFEAQAALDAAVALHQQPLNGRPVDVSVSKPRGDRGAPGGEGSKGKGKGGKGGKGKGGKGGGKGEGKGRVFGGKGLGYDSRKKGEETKEEAPAGHSSEPTAPAKGRPMPFAFVPRAVKKAASGEAGSGVATPAKSNEQFREMLLKK